MKERLSTDYPAARANWEATVVVLLGNDAGRIIAGSPSQTARFAEEYGKRRATPDEVSATLESVTLVAVPIQSAFDDSKSAVVPDGAILAEIERSEKFAADAIEGYRASAAAIAVVLERARAEGSTPSTMTLSEAVSKRTNAIREKQEGAAAGARRAAIEHRLQEIATQRTDRESLERQANDPKIVSAFAPFLEPNRYRVHAGSYGYGKHPAAYTDLQAAGVLSSVDRMVAAATKGYGRASWNRRATDDREKMQRAFDVLVKLAPVFVEQCKLLYAPDEGDRPESERLASCQRYSERKRRERDEKEAAEELKLRQELASLD